MSWDEYNVDTRKRCNRRPTTARHKYRPSDPSTPLPHQHTLTTSTSSYINKDPHSLNTTTRPLQSNTHSKHNATPSPSPRIQPLEQPGAGTRAAPPTANDAQRVRRSRRSPSTALSQQDPPPSYQWPSPHLPPLYPHPHPRHLRLIPQLRRSPLRRRQPSRVRPRGARGETRVHTAAAP